MSPIIDIFTGYPVKLKTGQRAPRDNTDKFNPIEAARMMAEMSRFYPPRMSIGEAYKEVMNYACKSRKPPSIIVSGAIKPA